MAENDIAVRVGADITDLRKGMSQGADSVNSFSASATAGLSKAGKSLVALAAAAAASAIAIGKLYSSGAQAIDAQSKLAQAVGGTIGGLRALEQAADDAGVSSEELNANLVKMNQRLGDASHGTGAAYDALQRLGLSAKALSGMDIDQRMIVIADRVKMLGLNSAQTADVMKDLGVKNENLANMMRSGGDAIREQSEQIKALGLNISAIDAAKVEEAQKSLHIFGDVLQHVQDKIAIAAAPYVTALANGFEDAAIESGGFEKQIDTVIKTVLKFIGFLGDALRGIQLAFQGLKVIGWGFGAAVISVLEMVGTAVSHLIDDLIIKKINSVIGAFNLLTGSSVNLIDTMTDSDFMKGLHDAGDYMRTGLGGSVDELFVLLNKELPSTAVEEWMKKANDAAAKTAASVVSMRPKNSEGTSVDTGDAEKQAQYKKEMEAWNEKNKNELEAVKQRYVTEEQLMQEYHDTMLVIGDTYDAKKFESESQWRSIHEQAEAEHLKRMEDLHRNSNGAISAMIQSHWGANAASTADSFRSILGTLATHSKRAFEISKAWALGDALISTYQGIAKGVALGFPAAIPAIAAASATGFAQVNAIRSQTYGGAGGAAASGNGSPGVAANPIGVGGSTSSGGRSSNQTLTVAPIDPNSIFSGSAMQSFGQKLVDFQKDGGKVIFSA